MINALCIVSSYQYMYAGVFGQLAEIQWYINLCESIFFFDFLLTFFVDFVPEDSPNHLGIRSFEKIFWHYLHGDMLFDLLPLIPFPMIPLPASQQSKFYVLKSIRIVKGMRGINVP